MEYEISETCKKLIAQLSLFLDDELDPALCAQIDEHLATCPYCRVVVDTTKKTITLFHDAPREDVPAIAREHLIHVLGLEKEHQ